MLPHKRPRFKPSLSLHLQGGSVISEPVQQVFFPPYLPFAPICPIKYLKNNVKIPRCYYMHYYVVIVCIYLSKNHTIQRQIVLPRSVPCRGKIRWGRYNMTPYIVVVFDNKNIHCFNGYLAYHLVSSDGNMKIYIYTHRDKSKLNILFTIICIFSLYQ